LLLLKKKEVTASGTGFFFYFVVKIKRLKTAGRRRGPAWPGKPGLATWAMTYCVGMLMEQKSSIAHRRMAAFASLPTFIFA